MVEEYGQPARSTSVSRKVYDADGAVLHEDTWYSSYRSRAEGRPRRHEAEAQARAEGEAEADEGRHGRPHDDRRRGRAAGVYAASALATASTNHGGSRIGRCVTPSTVACDVHPSATASPSRSTTYS